MMTDPLLLAKFVDDQIQDLEHKISQAVESYDRARITDSLIRVLGTQRSNEGPSYDDFITGYKELGFIKAFNNLLMAEISRDDGDFITALKYVADGNFDIGDYYGSHYIARKQRQDAGKNNYSNNRLKEFALIEYWQENRRLYEPRGKGGRLQAAKDFKEKGGFGGVSEVTMKDWLKNK